MITTITLNPCIDRTLTLSTVSLGQLNLVEKSRTDIGGKGINVAVALKQLDVPVRCVGISFAGNSTKLYESLDNLDIPYDFLIAPGDVRMNIKVVDTTKSEMTEFNSPGEQISRNVLEDFIGKLVTFAEDSDIIVLAGRLPNGADEDYYRNCIEVLKGYNVKIIVDAEGDALRHAITAKPYLVKPNAYELGMLFGREVHSFKDAVTHSKMIVEQGVEIVCCSLGALGAIIVDSDTVWIASALKIKPKGYQGAGDSMIAGICKAITEGQSPCEMLRYGIAAASSSLIREGTLLCQKTDFERFLADVAVEEQTQRGWWSK